MLESRLTSSLFAKCRDCKQLLNKDRMSLGVDSPLAAIIFRPMLFSMNLNLEKDHDFDEVIPFFTPLFTLTIDSLMCIADDFTNDLR